MRNKIMTGAFAALILFASINFADEADTTSDGSSAGEPATEAVATEEFAATVIQQEANVEVVQEIVTEEAAKKKITECEAAAAQWHAAKIRSINDNSSLTQEQKQQARECARINFRSQLDSCRGIKTPRCAEIEGPVATEPAK